MKLSKFFSVLFGLIGICAAISALWLSVHAMDAEPAIIETPEAALEQVEGMMDSFCAGDYAAASTYMYGNPDLGMDREAADEVGSLIWASFEKSMRYEFVGECYATNAGLAQNIRVTTMDISAVTDYIEANARTTIETRAQEEIDYDAVFDENSEYREEFINAVLKDVTMDALAQPNAGITTEVTLHLVWSDGRWWVVSNEALLNAVSGGIVK